MYSIVEDFYKPFDMKLSVRLSMWDENQPEKYLGGAELWNSAQEQLRQVLRTKGAEWSEEAGEAAFYGPKIDFTAKDALDRPWQLATIQLDFNLPQRFDLSYVAPDGHEARPVMLHRAILGSVERFMSVLIEHYAGAFPTWLAPVQAVVIPIADRHNEYAAQLTKTLVKAGFRVELDDAADRMQKKIRDAWALKVPYALIVGDKEAEQGEAAVRLRSGVDLKSMPVAALIERLSSEVINRQDIAATVS